MDSDYKGFVQSQDGTRIFYSVINDTAPETLVMVDGIGCFGFVWHYILEELQDTYRIVRWHYRGHGNSSLPSKKDALSIEHLAQDFDAVLQETNTKEFTVFGHSMGVQVVLYHALSRPRYTIKGFVLICGSYGKPLSTFHDTRYLELAFPYLITMTDTFPGIANLMWNKITPLKLISEGAKLLHEVNKYQVIEPDLEQYFQDLSEVHIKVFLHMAFLANQQTNESQIHTLSQPTLIISGEKDTFTPAWVSRRMHRLMGNSQLIEIKGASHAAPIEYPELINSRIIEFLDSL